MVFLQALLFIICAAIAIILAPTTKHTTRPIVTIDKGKFLGTTAGGVNKFLGIPFAKPPVGDLRFRLPKALGPYVGKYNATAFGLSCPQQAATFAVPDGLPHETVDYLSIISGTPILDGEDCLTLNVVAPSHVKRGSKLPVVVWIYGGGFEFGSSTLYDGGVIVNRSIALREPVIYVSMNYRVSAFGFLASQEVKDAKVGNLGLWDQRLALRWVQKYIHAFGGDPSKVTIWGESAGSISISLQMLANGGNNEGLFHAAFMQSGAPMSIGDITHGQQYYDFLVERTGCTSPSDTLTCLRAAPYEELKAAMDSTPSVNSYQSAALVWQPRVDGIFLADNPLELTRQGKVAKIPFVIGDCDDEGTLFSLSQTNVTTEAELRTYLSEFLFPNATDAQMDRLLTLYPQDVTRGSPYDTGTQNAFTPEFKRIASILGDFVFQAPRRIFLNNSSEKQNTWSYLSKRLKSLPILGSAHASDILNIYGGGDLTDYLIHFATNLDPNCGSGPHWPQYTTSSPQLLTLLDGAVPADITLDTYRVEAMKYLTKLSLANPQ
ncbi:Alpha/Beta hydrolase protein [Lactarius akahatsu]|uniref:Carboxylic ester hydrolase n=1 Tax=Lactarius akahatsu TaxID=416441 RepID=A0AAD4Q780_9AGAM|nr:Alpha/Beta hydrolase protein [Lactarius akahatsu]